MGDSQAVLTLVLGVLTLIALVASAVAVARASLSKSTIETLQSSNKALDERVVILEKENARQAARIIELAAENTTLKGIVSGAEAVERLALQTREGFDTMVLALGVLNERLGE